MVGDSGGGDGVVVGGAEVSMVSITHPNTPVATTKKMLHEGGPLESSEEPHPTSRNVIRIKDPQTGILLDLCV